MKARRSSAVACGHYVLTGQLIVNRGDGWRCLDCALARHQNVRGQPARGTANTEGTSMSDTTTKTNAAPIEQGWTDDKTRSPLYVSAPDPVLDGQQYAIQLCGTRDKDTAEPHVRLTFLGDVAELEDRKGIYEEADGVSDRIFGTDSYWLEADACAGLAGHLLLHLTRDGMTTDSRLSQAVANAAFKFLEHHAEHA